MQQRIIALMFLCLCTIRIGLAQEFKVWNRTVQVHGFVSQGFVKTDHNNWLTMNSRQFSGAMTDMGLNTTSQLTDKFSRISFQGRARRLAQPGRHDSSAESRVRQSRGGPG